MKPCLLSRIFAWAAIILACAMCATVAYEYRSLLCSGQHMGTGAPANLAFLLAIPYLIAIALSTALHLYFKKKQ